MTAAFVAAERLFGMAAHWRRIETATMPEPARIQSFDRAAGALRPQMADLLRAGAGLVQPSRLVGMLDPGIAALRKSADSLIGNEVRDQSMALRDKLVAAGTLEDVAAGTTRIFELDGAVGIALLAGELRLAAPAVARAFVSLGAHLGLDWTQSCAVRMNPSDPWERLLVAGIARDFQQMRLEFLRRRVKPGSDASQAVDAWVAGQATAIAEFRRMIARARSAVAVTPAMLAQLAGQARNLFTR